MTDDVYREMYETMALRGGAVQAKDIPEFYTLVKELFSPEEAAVNKVLPNTPATAGDMAPKLGQSVEEVQAVLESMAQKGLCMSEDKDGQRYYRGLPFIPGIFELQFMRGTMTEKDRRIARVIHAYKNTVSPPDRPPEAKFPMFRVIAVDRMIQPGNAIRTYDQVKAMIENTDVISVATCYCRHEAKLLDENDVCGAPDEVCMTFGAPAKFIIQRNMGREVSKEEALRLLLECEEAGLVHSGLNMQVDSFICNCCACHCGMIKQALRHPKPALVLSSGYCPDFDKDACTSCGICLDRCPAAALRLGDDECPEIDLDRCFGCGVCATGCPSEAVTLMKRPEVPDPPKDMAALLTSAMKFRSQQ